MEANSSKCLRVCLSISFVGKNSFTLKQKSYFNQFHFDTREMCKVKLERLVPSELEDMYVKLCAKRPDVPSIDHMAFVAGFKFRPGPPGTHFTYQASVKIVGRFNMDCREHEEILTSRQVQRLQLAKEKHAADAWQKLLNNAIRLDRMFEATMRRHPDAFLVWAREHANLERPYFTPPWCIEAIEGFHYPDLWAKLEETVFKAVEDSFEAIAKSQSSFKEMPDFIALHDRLNAGRKYMRCLSELFDEFNSKVVQKYFKRFGDTVAGSVSWRMPMYTVTLKPKDIFIGKRSYLSELYSQVETANA